MPRAGTVPIGPLAAAISVEDGDHCAGGLIHYRCERRQSIGGTGVADLGGELMPGISA